jgi:hypothetical protein
MLTSRSDVVGDHRRSCLAGVNPLQTAPVGRALLLLEVNNGALPC